MLTPLLHLVNAVFKNVLREHQYSALNTCFPMSTLRACKKARGKQIYLKPALLHANAAFKKVICSHKRSVLLLASFLVFFCAFGYLGLPKVSNFERGRKRDQNEVQSLLASQAAPQDKQDSINSSSNSNSSSSSSRNKDRKHHDFGDWE